MHPLPTKLLQTSSHSVFPHTFPSPIFLIQQSAHHCLFSFLNLGSGPAYTFYLNYWLTGLFFFYTKGPIEVCCFFPPGSSLNPAKNKKAVPAYMVADDSNLSKECPSKIVSVLQCQTRATTTKRGGVRSRESDMHRLCWQVVLFKLTEELALEMEFDSPTADSSRYVSKCPPLLLSWSCWPLTGWQRKGEQENSPRVNCALKVSQWVSYSNVIYHI